MLAAIVGLLGAVLLILIMIPLCAYGMIAFSPHSSKCRCSGCQRRIDRAQAEYDRQFPSPPGTEKHTMEEWEQIWEEAED